MKYLRGRGGVYIALLIGTVANRQTKEATFKLELNIIKSIE